MWNLPFEAVMLAGSLIAILALTALNAALGGWTTARIDTIDDAAARLDADVLGFAPSGEALVCASGRAALLGEAGAETVGLVVARGDQLVTRRLGKGQTLAAKVTRRGDLLLRLDDMTLPRVRLRCTDGDVAQAWAARLALSGRDAKSPHA